jgi:hypothetical protein
MHTLDDLSGLVSPRTIIYCEGKDSMNEGGNEAGLDAKVYNCIFGETHPDVLFVSSSGNTELDQRSDVAIRILSKVFPSVTILVCKDKDIASGKDCNEENRKLYLDNNHNNHRVIKRWEIENYLFDKSVLKKYCDDKKLTFSEIDYDKFVTDIVNQNVKDATGRMKNFCNITTNVNAEVFKENLSHYITPTMEVYKELEGCIFCRQ